MQESLSWSILSSFWASVKDGFSSLQRLLDVLEPEGIFALAFLQYHLNVITSRNQARSESSNAYAGRMKSPPTMSALTCRRALSWGMGSTMRSVSATCRPSTPSPIPRLARDLNSLVMKQRIPASRCRCPSAHMPPRPLVCALEADDRAQDVRLGHDAHELGPLEHR
jgi:hypothetical protein